MLVDDSSAPAHQPRPSARRWVAAWAARPSHASAFQRLRYAEPRRPFITPQRVPARRRCGSASHRWSRSAPLPWGADRDLPCSSRRVGRGARPRRRSPREQHLVRRQSCPQRTWNLAPGRPNAAPRSRRRQSVLAYDGHDAAARCWASADLPHQALRATMMIAAIEPTSSSWARRVDRSSAARRWFDIVGHNPMHQYRLRRCWQGPADASCAKPWIGQASRASARSSRIHPTNWLPKFGSERLIRQHLIDALLNGLLVVVGVPHQMLQLFGGNDRGAAAGATSRHRPVRRACVGIVLVDRPP